MTNGFPVDFGSPTRSLPESSGCPNELSTDGPDPSLHPDYRGFLTTMGRSECQRRNGTQSLTVSAAWDAPSRTSPPRADTVSAPAFPRSACKPQTGLTSPTCRAPLGQEPGLSPPQS